MSNHNIGSFPNKTIKEQGFRSLRKLIRVEKN